MAADRPRLRDATPVAGTATDKTTSSLLSKPAGAVRDCELLVVGAGIVGLACAREIARRHPRRRLIVVDKEPRIGAHQTSHNSGVIHAGIYYRPDSLKAALCVKGARMMYEFCDQHDVPVERCGKLIIARDKTQLPALEGLAQRARLNGVVGVSWLEASKIPEVEPHAHGAAALRSSNTGVVDYRLVAEHLARELRDLGHRIVLGSEVLGTEVLGAGLRVTHDKGEILTEQALFCAGAWSDRLARLAGADSDPRIVPFRGAYLLVRPERQHLVRGLIYPVPDPGLPFLGVHLSRHIDGSRTIGPTALMAGSRDAYRAWGIRLRDLADTVSWPGAWRVAWRYRRTAGTELLRAFDRRRIMQEAARYVPALRPQDAEPGAAGLRAQAVSRAGALIDDFVFSETDRALHVRNAPSPAATAALAIAEVVADRLDSRRR